jgi:DNA-binding SARP family transcriptional activator/tetratricopeptide (TPR) repeat protein
MDPRFQLRCLGSPVLTGPDGQPIRFGVRKHLALLVYLAVESRARHRRDHLAELLWPNLSEPEGRHSLATALSMLRGRFGRDVVDAGRDDLRWAHTRLDLDLDRLAAGNVLGDEFTAPLDVAGFLDGFEVPGAAEFMLWRERQRARWLPQVRDALVLLMDRCRRTGDSRQIEQLADRMIVLDDLSEEAIRAKMEARAFAGDRLTALKIFEAWKERLEEELGAAPSPLLEGMALRLRRRGWERSGSSHIPSVRTDQWKGRPFVGRANEYRALYEGWERTQRGAAGHALVLGESGIGKSTLVERLTTAAGLEGASVARVQCYDLEREIPYAVVCGLVRGLIERPGASATGPEALAELGRTVPEVRRRFANMPTPPDSEGETARLRLAEALHELVLSVAEEHPVILVVDDHHLADDASLAVLHLLMRRADTQPIMVVLVARQSEMGRSPQAARLKDGLPRLGASSVDLPPLTEAECEELLGSFIPSDRPQPNGAARRALVRAARGFPMILELLCQDWLAHGERSLALSLDAMTADPAQPGAPAEAYRQLYDRIVESLDPVTRNVLNLASILNHRLNDVTMYTLADLTVGQTMLGMTQLSTLRVLRDGGDGLEFVNELIRAHAYMHVPSAVRRVLHGNIADRLIEGERQGTEVQGLEVAWHCIRSGRPAEAAPYLLKGARQAIQRGAPQEAERGLSTGLPILVGADTDEGTLLLAEAFQEQSEWLESLRVLDSKDEEFTTRHHDRMFPMRTLARHYAGMIGADNVEPALKELQRIALVHLRSGLGSAALRVAVRLAYAEKLMAPADALFAVAEACEPSSDDPRALLELIYARAMLFDHVGQKDRSLMELNRALAILEEHSINSSMMGLVLIGIGAVLCSKGQYELATERFAAAHVLGHRRGADEAMAIAAMNLALCLARLGKHTEQIEWCRKGILTTGGRFIGYHSLQLHAFLAHGLALCGRPDEAVDAISRVETCLPKRISSWLRQYWQLGKADVLALAGRSGAARNEALIGLSGEHHVLHASSHAGAFARWLALTATSASAVEAMSRIEPLFTRVESFDALDQVEILGARRVLRERHLKNLFRPGLVRREERLLRDKILLLPPPTLRQLCTLGLPVLKG